MSIFSRKRRDAFVQAVKEYKKTLPPRRIVEALAKDGIKYSTLKSWLAGSSRDEFPVPPLPNSLLLLFLATGSIVFILLPEEVKACNSAGQSRYHVPAEMMELSARRSKLPEQMSKQAARELINQIRKLLESQIFREKPAEESSAKLSGSVGGPAYTHERLGEIADAIEVYYRHVLATVALKDRDKLCCDLQKRQWLRVRPEKRSAGEKKNIGPGPEIMWELFQRTRNEVFILRPNEVKIFQARKIVVPEEMLVLSTDFQKPLPLTVGAIELPALATPDKPIRMFSAGRVEELATIIGTWVNSLGTSADPVDDRFETRAAKILGLSPGEVFLLKTGRQIPSPENLARIYAVFPHEKLRLSEQEIALAKAAGLGVSEAEMLQKEIAARAAVGDSTLLVQVDTKVQAVLRVLEALVVRLPETRDLIGAGKLPEQKGLAILVSRQMNVIRATLLTLDALLSSVDAIVPDWKNSAIDLMSQMVKAFKLTAGDFQAREPKAVDDPDLMKMLDSLFGRGGTK